MRTEYAEVWISEDMARRINVLLDEREGHNIVHLRSTRLYDDDKPDTIWERVEFSTGHDPTATVEDRTYPTPD